MAMRLLKKYWKKRELFDLDNSLFNQLNHRFCLIILTLDSRMETLALMLLTQPVTLSWKLLNFEAMLLMVLFILANIETTSLNSSLVTYSTESSFSTDGLSFWNENWGAFSIGFIFAFVYLNSFSSDSELLFFTMFFGKTFGFVFFP